MKLPKPPAAPRLTSPKADEIVYDRYVDDTIRRFRWMTLLTAAGELVIMLLDFNAGFFRDDPLNRLNLVAELMLIFCSVPAFLLTWYIYLGNQVSRKNKLILIVGYRIIIMAAVLMFISTDVIVRHNSLGAYLVFLFALQITPAYKSITNWLQFLIIGLITVILFGRYVSTSSNTLFTTMSIFLAVALSTEFFRRFSIRQLEESSHAQLSRQRFERLAEQSIFALAAAVEAKDMYTKGHSQRVGEYSRQLASRMGYPEDRCQDVYYIGLMHDVGKIGIPGSVINKAGKLTDEEFAEIKKHPCIGYDILRQITELPGISEGARWHHERYDGRGYPDGLAGEAIPEIARIIAVSDAYDAMTSNRSYRGLMPQATVREQIAKNAGKQFDPEITQLMLQMIDGDTDYTMHE